MTSNDYIPKAFIQEYAVIFDMLTTSVGSNIFPNHEAFLGSKRHINGSKAALVTRMRNSFSSERHSFLKKDFEKLVKDTNPEFTARIEKIMDKLTKRIKAIRDEEALSSIGNVKAALDQIDRISKRARKRRETEEPAATVVAPISTRKNKKVPPLPDSRPIVVNPVFGLSHDRSKGPWNLHRKRMLYPVHINVQFAPEDGYCGGSIGRFTAYLPYGLHLIDAICMVEYETTGCTVNYSYIIFPRTICKIGKKEAIKKSNFYATAQSFRYMEKKRGYVPFRPDDYDDPTEVLLTALDNRMLQPGEELSHDWNIPDAFSKSFFWDKDHGGVIRNHASAIEAGILANSWYQESVGVFTGIGTYSVKFQAERAFVATLTNIDMLSYRAAEAYITRNPLPSTLALRPTPCTHRGIMVTNRNRRMEHVFSCKVNGRCTQWEPLWDGLCLIADDITGLYEVTVRFDESGLLHDNSDGVAARPIVLRPNTCREVGSYTIARVDTNNGYFIAFIPTVDIKQFTSIYSVAATNLVARVDKIVEGYSYIEERTRQRLNVLIAQRVETAYRQYAADATAAAALVNMALGCYNGIFSVAAREFIQDMTPDFISVLSSSRNFMRDSILRTTNQRLALTVAVGVSTGVATYGLGRDLSAISNLHPVIGNALACMVRGGLEEAWLQSVSWANPGLGIGLRLAVAATEFVRDVASGITPYASAVHALAAVTPSWIAAPLHVLYNGARGYVDTFGTGQATLSLQHRAVAVAILCFLVAYMRSTTQSENQPAPLDPSLQEGEVTDDEPQTLAELFNPAAQTREPPGIATEPVLQRALVSNVNEALMRSGVEVAIAEHTLPWKPLLQNSQFGDTLQVIRDEVVSYEEDLRNFGAQRSSTWLCWGGSRQRLPFHFGNSLVNLVGGVYRRLLVPAMRVIGPHNTPVAWEPPANFRINDGMSQIISSAVRDFSDNTQYWFEQWVNSRTAVQSKKYSDEAKKGRYVDVLHRACSQGSYKVKFFVKQEPTFNPSIRLIFPIEPLAEMAISPFVRCMENKFLHEMRSRLHYARNRQSIFTGGFDSLEKGAAWSVIRDNFDVNYVFAVDCTSWDSFVPGKLLQKYRELYPIMMQPVIDKQLTNPSHFEASKNGQFYLKAQRHTCTQLSGSPDTYILNSIVNAHILESFLEREDLDGQSMICGDDSLMTVRTNRPRAIVEDLIEHFGSFGLQAKVAYYDLDDPAVDFCSGHFMPIRQNVGHWRESYVWIPNPIKFVSKAFLIKTIAEEDIDQAQNRYLMSAYQMFKYTPAILNAIVPKRLHRQLRSFERSYPEIDYEFQLKYGGLVSNDRWRAPINPTERDVFRTLCMCGDFDSVFERDSMFFTPDFENELVNMDCPTLMPDTRAKYAANVMEYYDVLPPVYQGKLTYASLLASNPVFQLAVAEMNPGIIRARRALERSPFHVTLLNSPEAEHLRLHMAYTSRTDLFMRINSFAPPAAFVNPSYYVEALSDMGAREVIRAVNRHTQANIGYTTNDGVQTEPENPVPRVAPSELTVAPRRERETSQAAPRRERETNQAVPGRERETSHAAPKIKGKPSEEKEGKHRANPKAKGSTTDIKKTEVVITTKEETATRNEHKDSTPPKPGLKFGSVDAISKTAKHDMVRKEQAQPVNLSSVSPPIPPLGDLREMEEEARQWGRAMRGNTNILLSGRVSTIEEARGAVSDFISQTGYVEAYQRTTEKVNIGLPKMSDEFRTRLSQYNTKNKDKKEKASLYMRAFTEAERALIDGPIKASPRSQAEGSRITPIRRDSVNPREGPPSIDHNLTHTKKVISYPTKLHVQTLIKPLEQAQPTPVGREEPENSLEENVKK